MANLRLRMPGKRVGIDILSPHRHGDGSGHGYAFPGAALRSCMRVPSLGQADPELFPKHSAASCPGTIIVAVLRAH